MKRFFLLVLILCFMSGCGGKEESDYKTLMEQHEYVILDVRTEEEFLEGHIQNAKNIPYDEIDETIDLDRDKYIFVYCKSGKRSSQAYESLKKLGFTVYDLGALESIDLPKE